MRQGSNLALKGCLGCLGVLVVLGLVAAFFVVLPWIRGPESPEPVSETLAHELPAGPAVPVTPEAPELGGVRVPSARPEPWTLVLDVGMAELIIEPAPPGASLTVEASYDRANFELTEEISHEQRVYEVSFGARGALSGLLRSQNAGANEIRLLVPRDTPLALTGRVGVGRTRADLSGLWLTGIDVEVGVGDHHFGFEAATREPVGRVRFEGSMGELTLQGMGFASPEELTVDQGMGELMVDLTGPWRQDAEVRVDLGMGELLVRVPEGVAVDDRVDVGMGEVVRRLGDQEPPAGAPRLTLHVDGGMGEVVVRRVAAAPAEEPPP